MKLKRILKKIIPASWKKVEEESERCKSEILAEIERLSKKVEKQEKTISEIRKSFPDKKEIRKKHLAIRNAMSEPEKEEKSRKICEKLINSNWYTITDWIFGYYPLGKEADCLTFLRQALHDGKHVALPRTGTDCTMEFYEITSFAQTSEGAFHVMEPTVECRRINPMDLYDQQVAVLVPGVVFTPTGSRYGYGKGFYDRYFARFAKLNRYALAYENQLEPELEVLDTDIKMYRIYTETGEYDII